MRAIVLICPLVPLVECCCQRRVRIKFNVAVSGMLPIVGSCAISEIHLIWTNLLTLLLLYLDQIKSVIVTLMITVPPALQLQLSEAVTLIADNDFPDKWTSLIQVRFIGGKSIF